MQQRLHTAQNDTHIASVAEDEMTQPVTETLTVAQIKVLGDELGIAPSAVRQALQEKTGIQFTYAPTVRQKLPAIIRQDIKKGIAIAAGYSAVGLALLLTASALSNTSPNKSASASVYALTLAGLGYVILMTLILPCSYAWRRKDWRQGFLVGIPQSLFYGIAVALSYYTGNSNLNIGFITSFCLLVAAMALPLSMIGGWIGRWWHDRTILEEQQVIVRSE